MCRDDRKRATSGAKRAGRGDQAAATELARICLYCGERDCLAPRCIDSYERSRWMVCPDCDGQEWSELLERCGCMFGVVEDWPAPADGDRREAA